MKIVFSTLTGIIILGLEFDSAIGKEGNWRRIMANLKSSSGQETGSKKQKRARLLQYTGRC